VQSIIANSGCSDVEGRSWQKLSFKARPENDPSWSPAAGQSWDKPVVPMPQVERQLLSEAGVQRLSAQRGVTTEAGPSVVRLLPKPQSPNADIGGSAPPALAWECPLDTLRRRLNHTVRPSHRKDWNYLIATPLAMLMLIKLTGCKGAYGR
jgi:hypothetical protein